MKKRPKRRTKRRVPRHAAGSARLRPTFLQYKVVELSTVDEGSIERAVNHWVREGWNLDGVQFAMRESSKRPAMAFLFFTRPGDEPAHDVADAQRRLERLAEGGEPATGMATVTPMSAYDRLAQLAGLGEPERDE